MMLDEIYSTLTTIIRCMLNEDGCAASECDTCEYYLGDEFQMLPFMIQIRELVGQMRWTPVTETLPPSDEYVLATLQNVNGTRWVERVKHYPNTNSWSNGRAYISGVTAWMKMPEPWEGDKNETD